MRPYVVANLKEREPEYQQIAAKVAKKSGDEDGSGTRKVAAADATFGEQASRARVRAASGGGGSAPPKPKKTAKGAGTTAGGTQVPPRPRKTKKKK